MQNGKCSLRDVFSRVFWALEYWKVGRRNVGVPPVSVGFQKVGCPFGEVPIGVGAAEGHSWN